MRATTLINLVLCPFKLHSQITIIGRLPAHGHVKGYLSMQLGDPGKVKPSLDNSLPRFSRGVRHRLDCLMTQRPNKE